MNARAALACLALLASPAWAREPKIVIDPGHGGSQQGALSPSGFMEKELSLVLARKVGVSDEDIVRAQSGPNAEGWTELESATLRAADELHADACITDETWATLAEHLDDRQLIEVPVLVGQYHLVAYMLNSLGIELEPGLAFPTVPPNTWR